MPIYIEIYDDYFTAYTRRFQIATASPGRFHARLTRDMRGSGALLRYMRQKATSRRRQGLPRWHYRCRYMLSRHIILSRIGIAGERFLRCVDDIYTCDINLKFPCQPHHEPLPKSAFQNYKIYTSRLLPLLSPAAPSSVSPSRENIKRYLFSIIYFTSFIGDF